MPATVDLGFANWLKEGALWTSVPSPNAAAWIGRGVETEIVTPFSGKASTVAEITRQVGLLAGPTVRDNVVVPGARKDLLARTVTIRGDRLGYTAAGVACVVLGVVEQDNGTTILNVLRAV